MCRVGVLVHGCHLQAIDNAWERIVWGDPPHLLGRIPKAIHVAWRDNAERIVFGSGGSDLHGVWEGTFTRDYMLRNFADLMDFRIFRDNWDLGSLQSALRPFIESISRPDDISKNTREEILNAANDFEPEGITDMILVSSPTHLPRCLRDAYDTLYDPKRPERFQQLRQNLYATPSDTCYARSSAKDVAIVEPPHRGDLSDVPLHPFVHDLIKQFNGFRREPNEKDLQRALLDYLRAASGKFTTQCAVSSDSLDIRNALRELSNSPIH